MKKAIVGAFLLCVYFGYSQETNTSNYNKWSIEVNAGQNKAVKPFSNGYYSADPSNITALSSVNHFDLGVRYMLSNAFGLKVDFAQDQFTDLLGAGSLAFDTQQNRIGLQGVMNLGQMLKFSSFSKRLGLLLHGGLQFSQFTVNAGINDGVTEKNGGLMLGATPQVRLAKWLALTADFTFVNNVRQHLNWNGSTAASNDNLSGVLYSTSLGFTVYLGKKDKHADWFLVEDEIKDLSGKDDQAREKIAKLEKMLEDTDRDGIVDYLDTENNTPPGVAVDTKGRFIDLNKNGVADELEYSRGKESSNAEIQKVVSTESDLVESGLINIFFDLNSEKPNQGSSNNLFIILHYLQNNPTAKIKLFGFTDKRGDEALNLELAQKRAQNVYDFLVANNVKISQLSIEGMGVDNKFTDDTESSLHLARRVSIQIEK